MEIFFGVIDKYKINISKREQNLHWQHGGIYKGIVKNELQEQGINEVLMYEGEESDRER